MLIIFIIFAKDLTTFFFINQPLFNFFYQKNVHIFALPNRKTQLLLKTTKKLIKTLLIELNLWLELRNQYGKTV